MEIWIAINDWLTAINAVLWHDSVLYAVMATGLLFTVWSGFCQYHALTHGVAIIRGDYDKPDAPGAISHFQALSAALSATVGLGNIGGVAVAIALGGPGAVFWMWMVGIAGMALKTTEVTLSMLYRRTDNPDEPSGGPMWVADDGLAQRSEKLRPVGRVLGVLFCITLLISTLTGGNMFQAWNVGIVTEESFGVPQQAVGVVLALLVGAVILGGIKRIGAVAGALVPAMCFLYLAAALYVLAVHVADIPAMLRLIVASAFSPADAAGAFVGGTSGAAFVWGMKRALFSSEAGQGTSPIAHCAARTDEPVREGVVAGLEPFIDTLVVCTLTSLVVLASGAWCRDGEASLSAPPAAVQIEPGCWDLSDTPLPEKHAQALAITGTGWRPGDGVFMLARYGPIDPATGGDLQRVSGVVAVGAGDRLYVDWSPVGSPAAPLASAPALAGLDVYKDYVGAALTSHAFDRVAPGLGKWLVAVASWLFAVSTMISYAYYGEQGMVYMAGRRSVVPYKIVYCLSILLACAGWISTEAELDNITSVGTGVMLWVNIPITLLFAGVTMRAYREYFARLRAAKRR
ncbi:alanine/glycine:cation symporter family protein [Nannocystis bainbridge]|uniref:Amino acid carrier protein n=1 Tax=Nannocystis bainbridge TaxID=2995303 RepID=A0ABT5ECB0_9BACT|nr:amino acid carrier protein [Nannocystis bainbridge]MDC0722964.1 amino acid carrier protein [Nannocystis bainbridge]